MSDKLLSDRIGVHVVKFFEHFRAGINVEIIITALPETPQQVSLFRKTQAELTLHTALPCSQAARKSLLEDLDNLRGSNTSTLAEEQVDVFWHDHVADQSEAVASADFLENLRSKIPGAGGGQERPSLVAAEGDEVQVAASGDALEIFGHREKSSPPFAKTAKGRPPKKVLFITE